MAKNVAQFAVEQFYAYAEALSGPNGTRRVSYSLFYMRRKMPLGMEVVLSPVDFVLNGDPAPSPKRGGAPQFSSHVYCGQTAAWIKMPLGTEVGLGPSDFVFDGDPAKKVKVKASHTRHRALGPELIPVYRQSACR